jgi:protein-disulfide isomerase
MQMRSARARLRPIHLYGIAAAVALVTATALVLGSTLGSKDSSVTPARPSSGGASALFTGIPQRAATLGRPTAPVTLVEYADLQCPYCGLWARQQLPSIVHQLVRTGRLQITFHGLAFVGPDSQTALAGAIAAGKQNRLWDFVDLMYLSQGTENAGWVDTVLDETAAAARLDKDRWTSDRQSGSVLDEIDRLSNGAAAVGVRSTPSFALARTGEPPKLLDTHDLDATSLKALIDQLAPR